MAAVAGTGTSLSASYYLRNFYTANRNAVTSSKRKEMTGGTLSQADATALHRAAKKLRNFNYEDDTTDSANIYGSVNAFIQVYNNTLSSGNKTDDASLNRYSCLLYTSSFTFLKCQHFILSFQFWYDFVTHIKNHSIFG